MIEVEKSLTKTAQRLYISQPALSYRLKKLEDEFGAVLLNRSPSGVTFTPDGEHLLAYAKEMTERMEVLKDHFRISATPVTGTVRVGVSTAFAKYGFAPLLKDFSIRFPEVDIEMTTGSSTLELPDMLASNKVDVIIKRGDMPWSGMRHILAEEPRGIIASKEIVLERLLADPLIQDRSSVITGADKLFSAWWSERFGTPPEPKILSVNSVEACLDMVTRGIGWTFLPKIHVRDRAQLYFYPLAWNSGKPILIQTVMLYNEESALKPAVGRFIEYTLFHRADV